jgi:tetratricopeptide (TPR) repeat protein
MSQVDQTDTAERIAAANSLHAGGDWMKAFGEFESLVNERPNDLSVRLAYGKALIRREPANAEPQLRRALELAPGNLEAILELGRTLLSLDRFDDAEKLFRQALEIDPNLLGAVLRLARVCEIRGDALEAHSLYLRAVSIAPHKPKVLRSLATFLSSQAEAVALRAADIDTASPDSAILLGRTLIKAGRMAEAKAAFAQAVQADGNSAIARKEYAALDLLPDTEMPPARRPAIWPRNTSALDDLKKFIRRYILSELDIAQPLLSGKSHVVTTGSCFAEHIAARLKHRGVDVYYRKLDEEVNNTFASMYMVRWLADGPCDSICNQLEALHGADVREEMREHVRAADLFIFSLGVAPAYFSRKTGEFVLANGGTVEASLLPRLCEFRTTTVQENAQNVREMISRLREINPALKVVLTVSPVPIAATFERESAILADCVSKSVLRLTVEEVLGDDLEDVYYWPSFEIVRWLGAHLTSKHPPVFGADDGWNRHVSNWMVDMVLGLFIECVGEAELHGTDSSSASDLLPHLASEIAGEG